MMLFTYVIHRCYLCFLYMLTCIPSYTSSVLPLAYPYPSDELIANGCLNGLFVTGRTIGFIGHYVDQKRLKQGLYRHPWDDISYQTDL